MRNYLSIVFCIAFLSIASESLCQLQVTPNNNATQLAQTLAGSGVIISNVTKNCPNDASGTFNGTASNIGINGGTLLTTGQVINAVGPNNLPGVGTMNVVSFSDPDLVALEPTATYDPCILEFDVVPSCSILSFTFVFASEEYNEFVIGAPPPFGSYNDCFGIFVTGPNPLGPAYNGYDMALVPSTTTIVSINNVNNGYSMGCPAAGPCINCAYYTDNCNGTTVQYDGFTKPITATLNVTPCVSYHFKLAIADAGDFVWDSGVFFVAQSLQCNTPPVIAGTTSTPAGCTANNGSASATPTGGIAPYTYLWNSNPPQNTQTATGLAPGNYTVTIIDGTGCFSNTGTVTVGSTGGFTTTSAQTNVTCLGSNGSATVTPTGGTSPYTYSWSTAPAQTAATATGLSAGTYIVIVTDNNGCTQTQTVTIISGGTFTLSASSTPASCTANNGTAAVVPGGGTSPYTYSWSTVPAQNSATATGLSAGTYVATVTDNNGCMQTQTVTVTSAGAFTLSGSSTPASCTANDGTATVTPTGGTSPFTYSWSPSGGNNATATGLSAGNYTATVTDANGCTSTQAVTIINSNGPTLILSSQTNVLCNGGNTGAAAVAASGGTSPYTYFWTSGQTTSAVTNLSAGNYTVTLTDSNGCTSMQVVAITQPTLLAVTSSSVPACGLNNGSAIAAVSGGTLPYSYVWSPSGGNAQTATGLTTGNYTCTVTDANGCTLTTAIGVVAYPNPTATAFSNVTITQGESITLSASGGGSYMWSSGSSGSLITVAPLITTIYCVTITDANSCTDVSCVTVSVEPTNCAPVSTEEAFVLPNAFSPNTDGQNDKWRLLYAPLLADCIAECHVSVYSRWGELVFEGLNINFAWDGIYNGKTEGTAVFAYYLNATLKDGTKIKKKGNVSLLR